jgi:hypothetical protein
MIGSSLYLRIEETNLFLAPEVFNFGLSYFGVHQAEMQRSFSSGHQQPEALFKPGLK